MSPASRPTLMPGDLDGCLLRPPPRSARAWRLMHLLAALEVLGYDEAPPAGRTTAILRRHGLPVTLAQWGEDYDFGPE